MGFPILSFSLHVSASTGKQKLCAWLFYFIFYLITFLDKRRQRDVEREKASKGNETIKDQS